MIEGIQVLLFLTFISSTLPHWHTVSQKLESKLRGEGREGQEKEICKASQTPSHHSLPRSL